MKATRETKLPNGWARSEIGQITLPVEKLDTKDEPDRDIVYMDISGIDNARNIVSKVKRFTIKDAPSRARQIVYSGDVLFSTVRPYLRNIASVPERYNGEIASTGFSVLRPASGIDPGYLFYVTTSSDFVNSLSGQQYGVSYPAVKDEQVRSMPVCLPPSNEQRRIVAKIEELFSELDKGVESLKTAREQLKVYRQAVLKHAFEGKLTAQWREENKDKLESADKLSTRIRRERDARYKKKLKQWEEDLTYWEDNGKHRKKPSRPRPLKGLSSMTGQDLADLAGLPDGWLWDKLGWMTCGVEYGTAAKSAEEGTVVVLRMGNIQNARFDWTDLVYTSDPDEIDAYSLYPGDVLFNRTNSPELVGKAAIYRGEKPALFAGYLIRVNNVETIVLSQYLNLFLNSYVAKRHGNRVKTDGVNQSNINGEKLQNYPFPYCTILEQTEIVRIIDERLSAIDKAESDIEEQLLKSNALRQAILGKAFSGQLVAQDPTDEPASVLLERIRAEKAGEANGRKKNKRKEAA